MLSALLVLCEGKPTVKRISAASFDIFFDVNMHQLLNKELDRVAGDLGHPDAHVTSL